MEIVIIVIIGISLSMDAFSLSICCGTGKIKTNFIYLLSFTVGLYHFFMPLMGMFLGHLIHNLIYLSMEYIVFIIFFILGINMIVNSFKKIKPVILNNVYSILLFSFAVSIDSFSAGIGIKFVSTNYLLCCIIFSICSSFFTFIGFKIGMNLSEKFKYSASLLGGIALISFAFFYVLK